MRARNGARILRTLAQRALRRAAHPALARRGRRPKRFALPSPRAHYGRTTEIGPKTDVGQDASYRRPRLSRRRCIDMGRIVAACYPISDDHTTESHGYEEAPRGRPPEAGNMATREPWAPLQRCGAFR